MGDPTQIQDAMEKAMSNAPEDLLPLVYNELRELAAHKLANERPGQTLEATALVHEAWLRLEREKDRKFNDPTHFYCAAATAMRRILINNAHRKKTPKHGGNLQRITLGDVAPAELMSSDELIALDEALAEFAEVDADAARLVDLRFFVGLGHQEAARIMSITRRQADRLWAYARAWLFDAIEQNLGAMHEPKRPKQV